MTRTTFPSRLLALGLLLAAALAAPTGAATETAPGAAASGTPSCGVVQVGPFPPYAEVHPECAGGTVRWLEAVVQELREQVPPEPSAAASVGPFHR